MLDSSFKEEILYLDLAYDFDDSSRLFIIDMTFSLRYLFWRR